MSAQKTSATRCHLEHQAWSGQPAIQALPQSPLRRLALSMLFTIMTTSYQTTCTVSERTSIKGTLQCKPTRSSSFTLQQQLFEFLFCVKSGKLKRNYDLAHLRSRFFILSERVSLFWVQQWFFSKSTFLCTSLIYWKKIWSFSEFLLEKKFHLFIPNFVDLQVYR